MTQVNAASAEILSFCPHTRASYARRYQESKGMSIGEEVYLGLVLSLFVLFGVLLATLSWLDLRVDKVKKPQTAPKSTQSLGMS